MSWLFFDAPGAIEIKNQNIHLGGQAMYRLGKLLLVALFVTVAMAQSPEPPLSDTRLTVHTLLREDIFAGFLSDDLERLARGEKNIQTLLEKRPAEKSSLLAWKAGIATYRAVRAHEANRADEFQRKYREALDLFSQARELGSNDSGAVAVTGGVYAVFADRLPKEYRAPAWAQAYDAYQQLWKMQGAMVDRLPVHMRGELLGGLAVSAMRTGRDEEATRHLDKILAVLANTPYEPVAKKWKENPKASADASITCLTCHEQGRLAARLTALNNNK
jgi:tetratricopeptide (TPR) repeat protein